MIVDYFKTFADGAMAGKGLHSMSSVEEQANAGKKKGQAIGTGIGLALSPIIPFAPAIGGMLGGMIGGNAAQKKAERRKAMVESKSDSIKSIYKDLSAQLKNGQEIKALDRGIKDDFKANIV